MSKFFAVFLFTFFVAFPSYAENFTAKVNRNHVPMGETFILSLQYDGNPGSSEPDLTPLNKDFNIYSVGREYQSSNINGVASHIYQWNVALSPKVKGEAIIPAIAFKNLYSEPIKISIDDMPNEQNPKVSMSYSINNPSPYIQEQIIYTLTIKTTENLQGSMPQFIDDGNKNRIIKQLSEPSVSSTIENGIESKIITITYALFPQKSGALNIPQMQLNAYFFDKNKHRPVTSIFNAFFDDNFLNNFGFNTNATKVNMVTEPKTVEVQPIPPENNGNWWLPSNRVEISSDWEEKLPQFNAGEPVNRSITLTAFGVADTQMPKLIFAEVKGLKQYPEKPEITSYATNDGVVSKMSVNVVYIPEFGGEINIPEVKVPWYNLYSGQMENAVLPATNAKVAGNVNKKPQKLFKPAQPDADNQDVQENSFDEPAKNTLSNKVILALIVCSFVLGTALSWLIVLYNRSKKQTKSEPEKKQKNKDISLREKSLKEIRDTVLQWAQNIFRSEKVLNLDDVDNLFADKDLSAILQRLKKELYSGKKQGFNATELEKVMHRLSSQNKGKKRTSQILPELYK